MKKRSRVEYISKVTSFGFIFPAILVVALLLLYPVVSSVFYSFTNKNLIKPSYDFVGIKNYVDRSSLVLQQRWHWTISEKGRASTGRC